MKCHADEDELDKQFFDYIKNFLQAMIAVNAETAVRCIKEVFRQKIKEEYGMNYQTKHKPCDFLQEDGNCKLGDCKPDSCKKYPYTDQPERLSSLLSILDTIEICPAAFEIFERLKREYRFRVRR